MCKFKNLVKNEYIKSIKRVSTIIMLILVILAAIALPAFVKIASSLDGGYSEGMDWLIDDELTYNEDGDYPFAKAYTDTLKLAKSAGAESMYDWRTVVLTEVLDDAWANIESLVYESEEYQQYSEAFSEYGESEESDKYLAGVNKLYENYYSEYKASDTFKKLEAAVMSNDMKAIYDLKLEQCKADMPSDVSAPDYEYRFAKYELDCWFYGYLRDNNVYYSDKSADEWVSHNLSEYFSSEFADLLEIYDIKSTMIDYEKNPGSHLSQKEYDSAVNRLAYFNYTVEHDVEYNVADGISMNNELDFWSAFNFSTYGITFIGLLAIVVAALSVSSEFSNGTIKFLLINPVKRWKILVSKYFTVISTGYIMLAVMFVISLLTSLILFGGSLIGADYIRADGGEIIVTNGLVYMMKSYLLSSVEIVVMSTLAFAVSTLMKSSAFAIGISMFCMLTGKSIVMMLAAFNQDWARYLIFANLDLRSIANGSGMFLYQTAISAIGVIAIHMVVFWLIAWDGFTRREI